MMFFCLVDSLPSPVANKIGRPKGGALAFTGGGWRVRAGVGERRGGFLEIKLATLAFFGITFLLSAGRCMHEKEAPILIQKINMCIFHHIRVITS